MYTHPGKYVNEVDRLLALQKYPEAEIVIEKAIGRFPAHTELLLLASDVYRALNKLPKSLDCAYCLIGIHPNSPQGYIRATEDLLGLGRFVEAQQKANDGLIRLPDQKDMLRLARLSFIKYAQYLLTPIPGERLQLPAVIDVTRQLINLKLFDDAQSILKQVCDVNPSYAEIHAAFGELYLKRREYCLAAGEFQLACHQSCMNSKTFLRPWKHMAYAEALAGKKIVPNEHTACLFDFSHRSLVAFSSCKDYFSVIQKRRRSKFNMGATSDPAIDKNFLFVAGMARSGTTALGKLLNLSRQVELYHELYHDMRPNGYSASDFLSAAIHKRLRSRPRVVFESDSKIFNSKNSCSKYIGDKRPHLQFTLEQTYDNIVGNGYNLEVVFIYRNLRSVALSAEQRALDAHDLSWPSEHGMEHAILLHNASCRQLTYLGETRPEILRIIHFVSYDSVFKDPAICKSVFNRLSVSLSEAEALEVDRFIGHSRQYVERDRDKLESSSKLDHSIENLLDRDAHNKFCSLANLREYCY